MNICGCATFLQVTGKRGLRGPPNNTTCCHYVTDCQPVTDCKIQLLKTPHALVLGYRETALELSTKFPP